MGTVCSLVPSPVPNFAGASTTEAGPPVKPWHMPSELPNISYIVNPLLPGCHGNPQRSAIRGYPPVQETRIKPYL
ncbi:unnamed protein product [Protopolystoma xenopodis]|uniref:Uncharacterized protein n=1 Tax=Protopolystoma xenopodis TaxID=117903 RepID=A0A448XFB4_9PLAT|nr:unnamed protein product [Protopolystoma xenopodis]